MRKNRIWEPSFHDSEKISPVHSDDFGPIPEWKDQITIRGLVVSALLGSLFCIVTHKLNLTAGIIPSLNFTAGMLGFFFVKLWTGFMSWVFCSPLYQKLWVVMPFMAQGSYLYLIKIAYIDGFEEAAIGSILKETLKALDYLHRLGLIHCNVKDGIRGIVTRKWI